MKHWIVSVSADIPYPWEQTFYIEKSSPDAASSEAIKRFRKAIRKQKGKAKKLDEIRIIVRKGRSVEDSIDD